METIFSKIINRETPAYIVYENEHTIVIPDKFPSMPGQLLVIAKRQAPYIFDLPADEYTDLLLVAKKMAQALDVVFNTTRTCVVIEGFEVPHVHIRLYPCTEEKLLLEPRYEAKDTELEELASQLIKVL